MWGLDEIWLWIDEHSFKWRDMILVITDIKAKKVLWILDDIRKATLQKWYDELPDVIKAKMKGITSDMAQWYQNAILEKKPELLTSIDKYHLVQEANRMVDSVRMIEIWLAKSKFFNKEDSLRKWKISKKQAEKLLLEEKK
jgi:transposase